MPQIPIKREIRPTIFMMEARRDPTTGRVTVIVTHPMEGDRFVYTLDGEDRDRVRNEFDGIEVVPAGAIPTVPGETA